MLSIPSRPSSGSRWHRQAAVVYQMLITVCRIMHRQYGSEKHLGAISVEMFVAMVIRINDGAGLPPISISEISRQLGMSRTNVRRAIRALTKDGRFCKCGDGYIGNPDFVAGRTDRDDFMPEIQVAIANAHMQLDALSGKSSVMHYSEVMKQILDSIPTAAWRARPDGYIEFVNKGWLDYAGVSAEQALGWEWGALIHPDDLPALRETWLNVLASERTGEAEARMRRHDGSYGRLLVRAEPVRDDNGAVIAWHGTNMEIPQCGRLRKATGLEHSKEKLENGKGAQSSSHGNCIQNDA